MQLTEAKNQLLEGNTDILTMQPGCTSKCQPMDVCISKPFQHMIDWIKEGSVASVNSHAGLKAPPRKRRRHSSPDVMKKINVNHLCIRHRERDHVFLTSHNYWKATFGNKHYHVKKECIVIRNASFDPKKIDIVIPLDEKVCSFIFQRFRS